MRFKSSVLSVFIVIHMANAEGSSEFELKGHVGKYPVTMNINSTDDDKKLLHGYYTYDKYKKPIKLIGNIDIRNKYIIKEDSGEFQLKEEYGCRWNLLYGKWVGLNNKELPVELYLTSETTSNALPNGDIYKIVRKLNPETRSTNTYFLINDNKLETGAGCDESMGYHTVESININGQNIYKIYWRLDSTAAAYIDDGNTVYLHNNGDQLTGGIGGNKTSLFEYYKYECTIKFTDIKAIKTCINEEIKPENNRHTYSQNKKEIIYKVTSDGFLEEETNIFNRGATKVVDDPTALMREVEAMEWHKASNQ